MATPAVVSALGSRLPAARPMVATVQSSVNNVTAVARELQLMKNECEVRMAGHAYNGIQALG